MVSRKGISDTGEAIACPHGLELVRLVAPHALAFGFPLYALVFLLTGPHPGAAPLLFMIPVAIHALADRFSPRLSRQPGSDVPSWPFERARR